jgi:hypothetical protein
MSYLEIFLLLIVVCNVFTTGGLWLIAKRLEELEGCSQNTTGGLWLIAKRLEELEKK